MLIVKQALGKRLCKLRLADAGRAEEHEAADGTVRVCDTGTGAPNGLGDLLHGLVLAYHPAVENIVKVQKLFSFALHELCHGDARPLCDDTGYLLFGHGVMHHAV